MSWVMSEWKEKKLGELVHITKGKLTTQKDFQDNGFLPLINTEAITGNVLVYGLAKGSVLCNENDVLMLWDGERSGLVATNLCGIVGSTFAKLSVLNEIDNKYLFYFLTNKFYWIQNHRTGTGVPHVPKDLERILFVQYPVFIPEQHKIALILSTLDSVIEKTRSAIDKYKAIKQGMLHDLFTRGIDIKTGKLRPKHEDAPELYKPSKLGWIPKEWALANLEDSAIEIIDGDRGINYPKEKDFFETGFCLFLSAANVSKDGFKFDTNHFISEEKDELLGTGKLKREDLIVTTRGTVGNVVYYGNDIPYDHIRINSGMIILRNTDNKIQNEFLFHYVKEYIFEILHQTSLTGSAQPQLPIKDLKKFFIIYPIQQEQKELSKRLNSINKKLQTEQSYLHKLQMLKSGLMNDLLSGKKPVKVNDDIAVTDHSVTVQSG